MPNEQAPSQPYMNTGGRVSVHSIFSTIQAEGPFAGRAALFIRLEGCNLQCPLCDTEYTGSLMDGYPAAVLHYVHEHEYVDLVVITGGEPFRQNIAPLVGELLIDGRDVQIETNGTLAPDFGDALWLDNRITIVVSPKTGKIHPKLAMRADAFKYVLTAGDVNPKDGLPIRALGHKLGQMPHVARPPLDWRGPIYLQPADMRDNAATHENLLVVARTVQLKKKLNRCNLIMGVQMNKFVGMP